MHCVWSDLNVMIVCLSGEGTLKSRRMAGIGSSLGQLHPAMATNRFDIENNVVLDQAIRYAMRLRRAIVSLSRAPQLSGSASAECQMKRLKWESFIELTVRNIGQAV